MPCEYISLLTFLWEERLFYCLGFFLAVHLLLLKHGLRELAISSVFCLDFVTVLYNQGVGDKI